MNRVAGKADIILSLSRESEFPRRKEIEWDGTSTSYGPAGDERKDAAMTFVSQKSKRQQEEMF